MSNEGDVPALNACAVLNTNLRQTPCHDPEAIFVNEASAMLAIADLATVQERRSISKPGSGVQQFSANTRGPASCAAWDRTAHGSAVTLPYPCRKLPAIAMEAQYVRRSP